MVLVGVLMDQTENILYYLSNRWRLKIFRFLEANDGVVWVIDKPNSYFQKLLLLGYLFRN